VLGWVGHSDNLPYLERLDGVLGEIARRRPDTRLVVVADRPPRLAGIEVEFRRWRLEDEVSCFGGIGVGLMPLDDGPWTRGKCAFKALQYMALGIPTVASPVGMNREVIRDGETGLLPADEQAWVAALERLLAEPAFAARIGAAGRRTVEQRYALDVVSRRLVEILRERLTASP
jgi:glycosyltransferase involved in cell wall biosynthesis